MADARPRIVFILPTLLPGGAERVLITLMNNLPREKFEPHFLVVNEKGTLRDWIDPKIPFHSLHNQKLRLALPALVGKLNALTPDIIVSTMAGMNFIVLLAKPFLKKRARLIVREAVVPSSIIEGQKFPGIVKTAYKFLYPRADLILAPAQIIIDEFKKDLGMGNLKYELLHNPVDESRLRGDWAVDMDGANERAKTVRFVAAGRLHKQKGFDRLIESLPHLNMPREYDWRLDILGAGAEEENLKALIAQKGLGPRVNLTGLAQNPWPVYAAADAFLLPSRWEGLPNVALESLAVGTPVIASREAGGITEIAALAPKSVKLAADMPEFLKLMEQVKPNPAPGCRESLLPLAFKLSNVMQKFEALLDASR